jgi:hypothetical protein
MVAAGHTATATERETGVEIAAERFVDAAPGAVFAFLSNMENHWLLADRFVELVSLELAGGVGDGGTVRLRGPLRLHRTATTRVDAVSPERLAGSAAIGRRTHATLRWTLNPHDGGTAVRLAATVETLSLVDRLLLGLGGRRWLRVCFAATIERLAHQLAPLQYTGRENDGTGLYGYVGNTPLTATDPPGLHAMISRPQGIPIG